MFEGIEKILCHPIFSLNFGYWQHCVLCHVEWAQTYSWPYRSLCKPLPRKECCMKAMQTKKTTLTPLTSVPLIHMQEGRATQDLAAQQSCVTQHTSMEYITGKVIKTLIFFKLFLHLSFYHLLFRFYIVMIVS